MLYGSFRALLKELGARHTYCAMFDWAPLWWNFIDAITSGLIRHSYSPKQVNQHCATHRTRPPRDRNLRNEDSRQKVFSTRFPKLRHVFAYYRQGLKRVATVYLTTSSSPFSVWRGDYHIICVSFPSYVVNSNASRRAST